MKMSQPTAAHVGQRIRLFRKRNGLTLQQVCDELGWKPPHLSDIERGRRDIRTPEKLRLVLRAARMTPEQVLQVCRAARMLPPRLTGTLLQKSVSQWNKITRRW